MTETSGDRLAKVSFEVQVLQQLGVIAYKQEQFLKYQADCEAKSDAHGVRILNTENDTRGLRKDVDLNTTAIERVAVRTGNVESTVNRFDASRKALLWAAGVLFIAGCSIASVFAFVINLWWAKHG